MIHESDIGRPDFCGTCYGKGLEEGRAELAKARALAMEEAARLFDGEYPPGKLPIDRIFDALDDTP